MTDPLEKKVSFKWWRWDILAATAALNLLSLALALLIFHFSVSWGDSFVSSTGLLWISALLIMVFDLIIRQARGRLLNWLKMRYSYQLSSALFDRLTNSKIVNPSYRSVGNYLELIKQTKYLKKFVNSQEFLMFLNLPFSFTTLCGVMYLFPIMAGILFAGITFIAGAVHYNGTKLRTLLKEHHILEGQNDDFRAQVLSNYLTVKSLAMENLLQRRFEKLQFQAAFFNDKLIELHNAGRDVVSTLGYIILITAMAVMATQATQGQISINTISVGMFLLFISLEPTYSIFVHWFKIYYIRQLEHSFTQEDMGFPHCSASKVNCPELTGALRLENVQFTYPGKDKPVLSNLSLSIQPHTIVTIFGASGAGKTTLARLILNRLTPQQGKILIDGHELSEFSTAELARQVMYVPASTQIFSASVLDNLTLFRTGVIVEEAIKLAQEFGLESWIEALPSSYQTRLNDGLSVTLAEGIKQRIGLVRALLMEPRVLILDEANEALDQEGNSQLKKILLNLKVASTIIFITHRPSMKQIADESYDLIGGRLVPSLNVVSEVTAATFRPARVSGGSE
ncbi:ATP-binding cassette domain-containing protein [Candidatus Odyssella thessalonicensis]|uniref:ATP-binding cassette domain-containing protein n=1 Tax=Candidatus Odyssella thessalonicensis TaxID=84647 RepID=UPI000225A910|nr:ATP-binding cassette domain-containing protein [Candidatus Odyssella thessalonicensis]